MFRSGWRYVLAAFIGLTCLAASPPQNEWGQKQAYPYQSPRNGEGVAPLVESPHEAEHEKKPCEPGEDNRTSDLCAQWKAADAGADSARWARLTFWASLAGICVGLATLAAAIVAAKGAWDAARYTKISAVAATETLDFARTSSQIELRSYLTVSSVQGMFIYSPPDTELTDNTYFRNPFVLKVVIENTGQTPAKNVMLGAISEYVSGIEEFAPHSYGGDIEIYSPIVGRSLEAKDKVIVPLHYWFKGKIERVGFHIYGTLEYTDIFGKSESIDFAFKYIPVETIVSISWETKEVTFNFPDISVGEWFDFVPVPVERRRLRPTQWDAANRNN